MNADTGEPVYRGDERLLASDLARVRHSEVIGGIKAMKRLAKLDDRCLARCGRPIRPRSDVVPPLISLAGICRASSTTALPMRSTSSKAIRPRETPSARWRPARSAWRF